MELLTFLPLIIIMGAFMFFASRRQRKAMQASVVTRRVGAVGWLPWPGPISWNLACRPVGADVPSTLECHRLGAGGGVAGVPAHRRDSGVVGR